MFTLKEKELEGKRTILIVDDEEINGDILSSFLDDEFEIRRAFNGQECLDIIANEHEVIDLIVLDVMMPVMDGIEVLHILRKLEGYDLPPIIVLTANAITGMKEMYLNEGFDDYLSKPINTNELDRVVNKFFNK